MCVWRHAAIALQLHLQPAQLQPLAELLRCGYAAQQLLLKPLVSRNFCLVLAERFNFSVLI
jgi:hypothetical protein